MSAPDLSSLRDRIEAVDQQIIEGACNFKDELAIEIEATGLDQIAFSDAQGCGFPGQIRGIQAAAARNNSSIDSYLRACRHPHPVSQAQL